MSIDLDRNAIVELQRKYDYLINYESNDPNEPINPLTYVDSNGDNLLHIAAQLGDVRTISLLLDAGMKVNEAGDMGFTPLHYAYQGKHSEAVDYLLNHGAGRNLRNEFGKLPGE